MRMASVAAGVLLAHVGDGGVGMRRLDLERGDERVLGLDRDLVRLVAGPDPDHVPQGHGRVLLLIRPTAPWRVRQKVNLLPRGGKPRMDERMRRLAGWLL